MKIKTIILSTTLLLTKITKGAVINNVSVLSKRQEVQSFKYNIQCIDSDSKSICNNVEETTKKIAVDLSNTLEISNTITFNVFIDKLSKYEQEDTIICQCVDTNTVGLRLTEDNNSPPYVFPQALVKQLSLNKNINYKKNDFTLLVNIDGINKINGEGNGDFLYTSMLHEVLHGFGFMQKHTLKKLSKKDDSYFLIPKRISATTREEVEKIKSLADYDDFDQRFGGFYPISIYEKNIVGINNKNFLFENLGFLYRDINCFDPDTTFNIMSNENYKKCIEQMPDQTQQLISSLPGDYYLKEHSIGFLNTEGKVIPLHTLNNEYNSSTCVNHLEFAKTKDLNQFMDSLGSDRSQFNMNQNINESNVAQFFDENLLMCPNYYNQLNSDLFLSTIGKNNNYGWISPDILSILTTMGWTEKGKPKSNNVYNVAEDIVIQESLNFPLTIKEFYPKQSIDSSSSSSSSSSFSVRAFTNSRLLFISMFISFIILIL